MPIVILLVSMSFTGSRWAIVQACQWPDCSSRLMRTSWQAGKCPDCCRQCQCAPSAEMEGDNVDLGRPTDRVLFKPASDQIASADPCRPTGEPESVQVAAADVWLPRRKMSRLLRVQLYWLRSKLVTRLFSWYQWTDTCICKWSMFAGLWNVSPLRRCHRMI